MNKNRKREVEVHAIMMKEGVIVYKNSEVFEFSINWRITKSWKTGSRRKKLD